MKKYFRKDAVSTIEEFVIRNTGMTKEELVADRSPKKPYIRDLDKAVAVARSFMAQNPDKPVHVIGDFDADGVTSSSIMYWAFARLRANPIIRIPLRFTEGYGLSEKIITEIPDGSLVITVDNGIAASKAIQLAKDRGMTVIVTDHHLPPTEDGKVILPPADVIVDPHLGGSEFEDYCGAGIAYRFAVEITGGRDVPALRALAGIGTVADLVPLTGDNRFIVKDALNTLNRGMNVPGIQSLLNVLEIDHIGEKDIGFKIAPIINASGRLDDDGAMAPFRLFTGPRDEALAKELIIANETRKRLAKEAMDSVSASITDERPMVLFGKNVGEGIRGLVAGQLSENYSCPVIVFTETGDPDVLRGSGRSIPGINLKETLDKISDCILGYGGHAGAAGLSIRADRLDDFRKAFVQACGEIPKEASEITYQFDLPLRAAARFVQKQKMFAPYGEGNPQPLVHMLISRTGEYKRIGDGSHFMIRNPDMTIMGFGLADEYEAMGMPEHIDAVGYLSESWFNGISSIKFEIAAFRK